METAGEALVILGASFVVIMGGFLVALIFLKKRMTKTAGSIEPKSAPAASSSSKLLEIVKERYARGEITREQFEQLRKDLS